MSVINVVIADEILVCGCDVETKAHSCGEQENEILSQIKSQHVSIKHVGDVSGVF